MLHNATLLHPVGLAHDVNRDLDGDLLVTSDLQEVDMDELAARVVALDLPGHRQELVVVDVKVHQDVHPRLGVQEVEELAGVHAYVARLHAVAVDDRGNPALRSEPAGDSLPGPLAGLGLQLAFHGTPPNSACETDIAPVAALTIF